MKNVFLDLGTHLGQGLTHFIEVLNITSDWNISSYEANPVTYQTFQQTEHCKKLTTEFGVQFFNKAIYDHNGTININVETPPNEGETGMGSSVIPLTDWSPWQGTTKEYFKTNYTVECIDFSELIQNNIEHNIYCKMDIEGAEFKVLQKLINKDLLKYIKKIWVEFHDHFFTNSAEMKQAKNNILQYVSKQNIQLFEWH